MTGRAVPILMYHLVTPSPATPFRKYAVTPRAFAAQMRWLAATGHRAILPDALVAAREGRAELPRHPVMITFDDGFRDCIDHALPALRARGFTAVFYLVAGFVGGRSEWLVAEKGVEYPLFGWDAARALERQGFACEAHSLTHHRLTTLGADACRHELVESRRVLERELGREVRHLAYPFGIYDERVRATAVEAGYRSACSVRAGISDAADDRFALHRVPVSGHDSLLDFVCRLRTARNWGETVRRATRRFGRRADESAAVSDLVP
ncbi:MAG TPA: polysaccharide deacetylase family protein [Gemmatimonadales bacterium]|nr:polysaccharide deacetylase family protein [Gemmatimonadales bacterium]